MFSSCRFSAAVDWFSVVVGSEIAELRSVSTLGMVQMFGQTPTAQSTVGE